MHLRLIDFDKKSYKNIEQIERKTYNKSTKGGIANVNYSNRIKNESQQVSGACNKGRYIYYAIWKSGREIDKSISGSSGYCEISFWKRTG